MTRKLLIEIMAASLVLLWVYAAISKLLDYQRFVVQLGKSPLVDKYASLVAIVIPTIEIIIAIALMTKRYRLIGFYASAFMLIMFTSYLIAILNFSYYIPCSCGGILGGLSFKTHIVFNLAFALIATTGILLTLKNAPDNKTNKHALDIA